jgi:hypothetical protein
MTDTQIRVLSPMELKDEQIVALREQVYNLSAELNHYRDANQLPGWLQGKVMRQAKALTRLNKRVRFQRAMLRALNEQHPDIADSIFQTAKVEVPLEEGETLTF